jgi:hypothetical protein
MPAPGIIERIAAQSMMGADSEEITKAVESIAAQSEEQAEVLRDLEERRQLEERAKRENMPIVYVLKEQYRKLDPTYRGRKHIPFAKETYTFCQRKV